MSKRHVHIKRSGMQGNGGRFAPNNGHPSHETSPTSLHAAPTTPYRVASSDGRGLERHRGHKFSQATYESLRLGW